MSSLENVEEGPVIRIERGPEENQLPFWKRLRSGSSQVFIPERLAWTLVILSMIVFAIEGIYDIVSGAEVINGWYFLLAGSYFWVIVGAYRKRRRANREWDWWTSPENFRTKREYWQFNRRGIEYGIEDDSAGEPPSVVFCVFLSWFWFLKVSGVREIGRGKLELTTFDIDIEVKSKELSSGVIRQIKSWWKEARNAEAGERGQEAVRN